MPDVVISEEVRIAQTLEPLKIVDGSSRVVLLITGVPLVDTELGIFRYLGQRKRAVLTVCVDRPASSYLQQLGGVLPPQNLYAVEVGTAGSALAGWSKENRALVDSSSNLSEIGRSLENLSQAARRRKDNLVLVFSAGSSLLLYHDVRGLGRFLLDQLNRMRAAGTQVVVIIPPSPELERMVRPMADRVIEIFLKPEEKLARAFG